ncbi:MAG: hypothetical protein REI11_05215 [Patulibacter sp.]|nr:hypothetical protein [Patulibacter sp.]
MPVRPFPAAGRVAAFAVACAAVTIAAPADGSTPVAHAAKQKSSKKKTTTSKKKTTKKAEGTTATVNGVFTVRKDIEGGFGNDHGEFWEQISLTIKDAKIPYHGDNGFASSADATVTFEYTAKAHTDDRSWHAGCDVEEHTTTGTWTGKTRVGLAPAKAWRTAGKSAYKGGWAVSADLPDDLKLTSTGYWQDWDSLWQNCITTPDTSLLGAWSWGFAHPVGFGKGLSSDNKSVVLSHVDTEVDQTGSATGGISFSAPVKQ